MTQPVRTEKRRGTLPLDSPINIKDFSYLTFDVYVEGDKADTCALGNLYVELWDTETHPKRLYQRQGACKAVMSHGAGNRAASGAVGTPYGGCC